MHVCRHASIDSKAKSFKRSICEGINKPLDKPKVLLLLMRNYYIGWVVVVDDEEAKGIEQDTEIVSQIKTRRLLMKTTKTAVTTLFNKWLWGLLSIHISNNNKKTMEETTPNHPFLPQQQQQQQHWNNAQGIFLLLNKDPILSEYPP